MTTVLPEQLSSAGRALDMSVDAFGLLDVQEAGEPVEALREHLHTRGYLFLRDLLDRDAVARGRRSVLEALAARGHLDPRAPLDEGLPNPDAPPPGFIPDIAMASKEVSAVLHGDALMGFFARLLGGPAMHFDFTWFRCPGRGHGTLPHCDIVYMSRGTHHLYTMWVPFGDIPVEQGGLMILEDSPLQADRLRKYLSRDVDEFCENRPGADDYAEARKGWNGALSNNPVSLREHLGGRWLTAGGYRMGDALIFTMATVHAALDSHRDNLRLSSDSRYQLASEPVDHRWVGENPVAHGKAAKRGRIC